MVFLISSKISKFDTRLLSSSTIKLGFVCSFKLQVLKTTLFVNQYHTRKLRFSNILFTLGENKRVLRYTLDPQWFVNYIWSTTHAKSEIHAKSGHMPFLDQLHMQKHSLYTPIISKKFIKIWSELLRRGQKNTLAIFQFYSTILRHILSKPLTYTIPGRLKSDIPQRFVNYIWSAFLCMKIVTPICQSFGVFLIFTPSDTPMFTNVFLFPSPHIPFNSISTISPSVNKMCENLNFLVWYWLTNNVDFKTCNLKLQTNPIVELGELVLRCFTKFYDTPRLNLVKLNHARSQPDPNIIC